MEQFPGRVLYKGRELFWSNMILSPENELIVRDSPTLGPDGFATSWKCDTNSGFEVDDTNQDLVDLSLWMERW